MEKTLLCWVSHPGKRWRRGGAEILYNMVVSGSVASHGSCVTYPFYSFFSRRTHMKERFLKSFKLNEPFFKSASSELVERDLKDDKSSSPFFGSKHIFSRDRHICIYIQMQRVEPGIPKSRFDHHKPDGFKSHSSLVASLY